MPGVETGLHAMSFLSNDWCGQTFMAIGLQDPVLGEAPMRALQKRIRRCPEPMLVQDAGHFVQEWGEPVARSALAHFGLEGSAS
jgi:haloalkane dehalogenase